MAQRTHTIGVVLRVVGNVVLDDTTLPVGATFPGACKQTELSTAPTSWTDPQYRLKLSAEELARVGVENPDRAASVDYNVTKFVNFGDLMVT
jgi:hypothetical protein